MLDSTHCFFKYKYNSSILFPRQSSPAASDDNEKVWRRGLNLEEAFRERESADVVYVRVKIFSSYLNKAFCEILLKVPLTQRKHFVRFCTIAKMFPQFSCLENFYHPLWTHLTKSRPSCFAFFSFVHCHEIGSKHGGWYDIFI